MLLRNASDFPDAREGVDRRREHHTVAFSAGPRRRRDAIANGADEFGPADQSQFEEPVIGQVGFAGDVVSALSAAASLALVRQ